MPFVSITPSVFQVGGDHLSAPEDAAVFLVKHGGAGVLIDSGTGFETRRILANIRDTGCRMQDVRALLLTHCHFDHTGGAREIRDATGAEVMIHEADAPFIIQGDSSTTAASWYGAVMPKTPVDVRISGSGEICRIGDLVIHGLFIPGHSPGSMAFYLKEDGKAVLFGQDVHGPIHPLLKSDREMYQKSLRKILSVNADILCEGHFGIISGKAGVSDFIHDYIQE